MSISLQNANLHTISRSIVVKFLQICLRHLYFSSRRTQSSLSSIRFCLRNANGPYPLHFLNAFENGLVSSKPHLNATSFTFASGYSDSSRSASRICMLVINCFGVYPVLTYNAGGRFAPTAQVFPLCPPHRSDATGWHPRQSWQQGRQIPCVSAKRVPATTPFQKLPMAGVH